jgi:hypothetical protein
MHNGIGESKPVVRQLAELQGGEGRFLLEVKYIDALGHETDVGQILFQAKGVEGAPGIGAYLQTGPKFLNGIVAFEYQRFDATLSQGQGQRESGNASACDSYNVAVFSDVVNSLGYFW